MTNSKRKRKARKHSEESSGHQWFYFQHDKFQCCRNCGLVRRDDDKNSQCRGKVKVELRNL